MGEGEGQAVPVAQEERRDKEGGRGFTNHPALLGTPTFAYFWDFFLKGGGGKLVVVPAFRLIAHRTAWLQKGL